MRSSITRGLTRKHLPRYSRTDCILNWMITKLPKDVSLLNTFRLSHLPCQIPVWFLKQVDFSFTVHTVSKITYDSIWMSLPKNTIEDRIFYHNVTYDATLWVCTFEGRRAQCAVCSTCTNSPTAVQCWSLPSAHCTLPMLLQRSICIWHNDRVPIPIYAMFRVCKCAYSSSLLQTSRVAPQSLQAVSSRGSSLRPGDTRAPPPSQTSSAQM
jgi:hypothetical protein